MYKRVSGVEIDTVTYRPIIMYEVFSGKIENSALFKVISPIEGQIKSILVQPGEEVKANELIFEIDAVHYDESLINTTMTIEDITTSLKKCEKEFELKNTEYKYLLSSKEKEVEIAESDLENLKKLYKSGFLAYQKILDLEKKIDDLKQELEYNRERILIEQQIYECEIETLNNKIDIYYKEKEELLKKIAGKKVYSQSTGYIVDIYISEGEYVKENQECYTFQQKENNTLKFRIPITKAHTVDIGMRVYVLYNNKEYSGTVSKIFRGIRSDSYNSEYLEGSVVLDDKMIISDFLPGMPIEVRVELVKKEKALVIKRGDFVADSYMRYVYIIENDNIARKVPITTGIYNDEWIEVNSGLKEGDKIIVSDYSGFSNLDMVRVTGEEY